MVVYTLEQVGLRSTYRRFQFWQKEIILSDEAHFDLGGYVNKQIRRIWTAENQHAYIEKPTHPKRVTVSCAGTQVNLGCFSGHRRSLQPCGTRCYFRRTDKTGCTGKLSWKPNGINGLRKAFIVLYACNKILGKMVRDT